MADAAAPKTETIPENAQDLTAFVQNMLEQMVIYKLSPICCSFCSFMKALFFL